MLENRSFDHMLGYLMLEGGRTDVDGLTSNMSNIDDKGREHRVRHLTSTLFEESPCHSGTCTDEQIGNNMGGFVKNFAKHYPDVADPGKIMGYYNAANVPIYDHLAREFMICDRWFSSVPGETWPNRLYALTGHADGSRDNKGVFGIEFPIYDKPSFLRHLDSHDVPWRWYCHDFSTLRLVDGKYRIGFYDKFFYFDKKSIFHRENFLDHAAAGNLAAVSWIDPNFVAVGDPANANDDHPPADIRAGQVLVNKLYQALLRSPAWGKTLLVITYDEHGGIFDHVVPPPAADDTPSFRRYGCRVPTFIVSPWIKKGGVSHMVFDHTSIIKTILLRFCSQTDGSIPNMGARIADANHLGNLLTEDVPRPALPPQHPQLQTLKNLISNLDAARQVEQTQRAVPRLTDSQRRLLASKHELAALGLPENCP